MAEARRELRRELLKGIPDQALCRQWDSEDPMAACRQRFDLPTDTIYLDGNSLGPLPKSVPAYIAKAVTKDWGQGLIRSWNDAAWIDLPQTLGDRLAGLMGAGSGQVIVTDSTSVNLYKTLMAALRLQDSRRVIVSELGNFPTDLYMSEGVKASQPRGESGCERRLLGRDGDTLESLMDEQVAVVFLTHVNFKTAEFHDIREVTALAHRYGALVVWDLAHSLGVLPLDLDHDQVDFAVGCTYKYLNGGPGSPAFVYAARRHHGSALQPLTGWFGHEDPFAFSPDYEPAPDIRQFLCGTPPVLSFLALERALDIYDDVDIHAIRAKSVRLTSLFVQLTEQRLSEYGFTLSSPKESATRGSHVSIAHKDGYAIVQALIERGVIGDFRAPDNLRFGFAPLFNQYEEVWQAVDILVDIMQTEVWRKAEFQSRRAVT